MFLRLAERVPGGRAMIFLLPVVLLTLGFVILDAQRLVQIDNSVMLALTVAMLFSWRESLWIFLRERDDAGAIWLSLGIFIIVATTVLSVGYSTWIRAYGQFSDATATDIVAVLHFAYAFGFGSLYLVPLARDAIVPPTGWLSLIGITAGATAVTLFLMWWF